VIYATYLPKQLGPALPSRETGAFVTKRGPEGSRPKVFSSGPLLGALALVGVVQALQAGSIEGATGGVGRTLLHSVSAQEECEARTPQQTQPHPLVHSALSAYEGALSRAASSGVPGNKQPGGLISRLSRGLDNPLEALGGRVPPERALQLAALTIPLRSSGPARDVALEPAPVVARLCR
jgi:hypothetical protein